MADTLEPIVIPPLKVEKHFTCSGSGLLYEDQERVSSETLRSLLLPSGGRNGISDRERSKAWWGAQALFYGFKYTKTMTIAQVRAQIEDALRDKNKGLRVPQNILDLEYKYNKEFRELNAQVRDKAGMGVKRKREADTVVPKTTKSKSADVSPAPKRTQSTKTKVETSTPDSVPTKKPRIKEGDNAGETAKPRTKQTAKKTTRATEEPQMDWMEVDVKLRIPNPGPKPRTKQTAKRTAPPADAASWMNVDIKPPPSQDVPKPRTKQTARKTMHPADESDIDEMHAPRTKMTTRRTAPVEALASSSSMPQPAARTKQTARRGRPFPAPPARSSGPRTDAISGMWAIDCPAISDQWVWMQDFTLNIVAHGASATLEGEFELGIISGLLRCARVEQRGANGAYAAVQWAGQENDGPVCPPNPGQSGYIKFTGDRHRGKLNNVPACGDVEFEGQWVGDAGRIVASWDNYDEDAYERANTNRWH
ncbi:hypothetical protein B0H11DRAFT_2190704 [Mycena galericulata]|nr:hypothetical protein B0H11DRAFT_2190704 [Mycena galericulata]